MGIVPLLRTVLTTTIEITGRSAELGGISIDRFLPKAQLRTVGPWCVVDRMSNLTKPNLAAMEVAPHPHFGLSTVTFLLNGGVEHSDSMGNHVTIRPGQINIMTAGAGVSHSEVSSSGEALAGLQLWAALPIQSYLGSPNFEHYPRTGRIETRDFSVDLISGEFLGEKFDVGLSHSALGAVVTSKVANFEVPLNPHLQHIFVPIDGDYVVSDVATPKAVFLTDSGVASFSGAIGSKFLILGGEPFGEKILMWWNFVGRSWDEMVEARRQWSEQEGRFGEFVSNLDRIPAPAILQRFSPRSVI